MKKKRVKWKVIHFILLGLIILGFAFYSFLNISGNLVKNSATQPLPTGETTFFCCEKTKTGSWCQNVDNVNLCNANYSIVPTSCDVASFCALGYCYDQYRRTCYPNVPRSACLGNGGMWSKDSAICPTSSSCYYDKTMGRIVCA